MDNRKKGGGIRNRKKTAAIIGGVVGVALVAWIVLMVTIFSKDKPKPKDEPKKEQPTEAAEETVSRLAAYYEITETGDKRLAQRYDYDSLGRLVGETLFDSNGQVTSVRTVKYDASGNMIEYRNDYKLSGNDEMWKWEFSYFPSGVLKECVETDTNGSIYQKDVYNEKGVLVSHFIFEYELSRLYTYNDKGDPLQTQRILNTGETIIDEENVYSDSGLLMETISEPNGTKIYYTYDESGNRTKSQKFLGNELISEDIYYPMNIDEIHRDTHVFTEGGEYYHITDHYEYDEQGHVKRHTLYNQGGGIEEDYSCEYDADGRETRREYYDEEGNVKFGFDYTYNDLSVRIGDCCKSVTWNGPNHEFHQSEEYEYFVNEGIPSLCEYPRHYDIPGDAVGAIASMTLLSSGEKTGFYFEKDADGNPTRMIRVGLDGNETVEGEREYIKMTIKKQN